MAVDLFKNEKNRTVFCDDAHKWLENNKNNKAIITSLPDMEEVGLNLKEWQEWIKKTCLIISSALNDDGIVIFYQTDRKYKGSIIDKKTLISQIFFELGYKSIFNKIVLKQKIETVNLFRPGFTNMFGFSKNIKSGKATPDVINSGKMIYKNAMGLDACKVAIDFIKTKINPEEILDPFCGQGSVLKIANENGFDSVGVEILREQCKKAKLL